MPSDTTDTNTAGATSATYTLPEAFSDVTALQAQLAALQAQADADQPVIDKMRQFFGL